MSCGTAYPWASFSTTQCIVWKRCDKTSSVPPTTRLDTQLRSIRVTLASVRVENVEIGRSSKSTLRTTPRVGGISTPPSILIHFSDRDIARLIRHKKNASMKFSGNSRQEIPLVLKRDANQRCVREHDLCKPIT